MNAQLSFNVAKLKVFSSFLNFLWLLWKSRKVLLRLKVLSSRVLVCLSCSSFLNYGFSSWHKQELLKSFERLSDDGWMDFGQQFFKLSAWNAIKNLFCKSSIISTENSGKFSLQLHYIEDSIVQDLSGSYYRLNQYLRIHKLFNFIHDPTEAWSEILKCDSSGETLYRAPMRDIFTISSRFDKRG